MKHKKLLFETSVIWAEKTMGYVITPSSDEHIEVATPVEFPDGEEGKWTSESLYLGAVGSCFMTTFVAFAKRKNLAFIKFNCHAAGEVDYVNGKLALTSVELFPEVHLMEDEQEPLAEEVLR